MRKVMSWPEWIGVAIMLVGIGMGYYGSVASTLGVSRAVGGLGATVSGVEDTEALGGALANVSTNMGAAMKSRTIADIGAWTFWLGIAVFVVASRLSWNAAFRRMSQHASRTVSDPVSGAP
ncbi:MAG: hypothetical protein ACYS9X_09335 [Planctomycetota bacterium]|jgi:hypothetical protein